MARYEIGDAEELFLCYLDVISHWQIRDDSSFVIREFVDSALL
jgi:hypothetical protein